MYLSRRLYHIHLHDVAKAIVQDGPHYVQFPLIFDFLLCVWIHFMAIIHRKQWTIELLIILPAVLIMNPCCMYMMSIELAWHLFVCVVSMIFAFRLQ